MKKERILVHRHTGGLEKQVFPMVNVRLVHRHTGGLEMIKITGFVPTGVHRHTGGLEINAVKQ